MKNYGVNLELERQHQKPTDHIFGAVSSPCIALIPESEREQYLPVGELQNEGEEKFDCATRGPTNIYETKFTYLYKTGKLSPENKKWLEDNGYVKDGRIVFSDRFNAILSGTSREGNSLIAPLQSIHSNGMIPKAMLPQVASFDAYYDPASITQEMKDLGQGFLKRFVLKYDRVLTFSDQLYLPKDILDVAGFAWTMPVNGVYPNPGNLDPNHCFILFKRAKWAFDNYLDTDSDFIKHLADDYELLQYGYRCYIAREVTQADREIANNVMDALSRNNLLAYFIDWWMRFQDTLGFSTFGVARSPKWPTVQKSFLALHPNCAVCGSRKDLNVHHKVPVHVNRTRELDETNLMTLCRRDHYVFGHLMDWASYNKDVESDARLYELKVKYRP